jgi:hypothetical protein
MTRAAEVARPYLEHVDYYNLYDGMLRLGLKESADVRLIPGYNFQTEDVECEPNGEIKVDGNGWTFRLTTNDAREDYYAWWWGPDTGENGEQVVEAKLVYPEDIQRRARP